MAISLLKEAPDDLKVNNLHYSFRTPPFLSFHVITAAEQRVAFYTINKVHNHLIQTFKEFLVKALAAYNFVEVKDGRQPGCDRPRSVRGCRDPSSAAAPTTRSGRGATAVAESVRHDCRSRPTAQQRPRPAADRQPYQKRPAQQSPTQKGPAQQHPSPRWPGDPRERYVPAESSRT